MHVKKTHFTTPVIYNRLPEDELSGSKHVEDIIKIKNKSINLKMCILLVYIV